MSEKSATMSFMKNTAEGFSQGIGWVDFSREMAQNEVTGTTPFLDCKPLDINMASPFGGLAIVDYVDSGLVVFKDNCGSRWGKTKFAKDRANIAADLTSVDGGKELGFSRASGNDGLSLHTVGNSSAGHDEGIPSSRAFVAQVIGVGGIDDGEEFRESNVGRIGREIVRVEMGRDRVNRDMGQGRIRCRAPVE